MLLPYLTGVSGWVTISQARFGGQISEIARQFQGLNNDNEPNVQQKMSTRAPSNPALCPRAAARTGVC